MSVISNIFQSRRSRSSTRTGPAQKQELKLTRGGRYFLFASRGAIWRMDLDGGNPVQLTHDGWSVHPASSADSRFVYYVCFRNWSPAIWGKPTLWRVPIEGGESVEVVSDAVSFPEISPYGKKVACAYYPGPNPEYSASPLAVFSTADGRLLHVFDQVSLASDGAAWTPDGNSLIYPVRTWGVDNLWRVPLAGRQASPITNFQIGYLFDYSFSPDFKNIAMVPWPPSNGRRVDQRVPVRKGKFFRAGGGNGFEMSL